MKETPMFILGLVDILAALFVLLFVYFGVFELLVYPLMFVIMLKGLWTLRKSW
jgi:hypothetical protein